MIYVRSPSESGRTRVLMVPGLTPSAARGTAIWLERFDGTVFRVHATYAHETGGVPVLVEDRREPCTEVDAEAAVAVRLDADGASPGSDREIATE